MSPNSRLWDWFRYLHVSLSSTPEPSPLQWEEACWTLWVRPPTILRQFNTNIYQSFQIAHTDKLIINDCRSHWIIYFFASLQMKHSKNHSVVFQGWFCGFLRLGAGNWCLSEGTAPGGSSLLRGSGGGSTDSAAPCSLPARSVPALHPQPHPDKPCPPVSQAVFTRVGEELCLLLNRANIGK